MVEPSARRTMFNATGGWLLKRAKERTTWVGLAILAAAFGRSTLSDHLKVLADAVPLILGAGLVVTSNSNSN